MTTELTTTITTNMIEFWEALRDPDFNFLRIALLMGVFASVAFGISGSFVVARRITYIAGAIAHAVLGGIGFALYMQQVHGWTFFDPLLGATLSALVSAWLISWIQLRGSDREDSLIGVIWATGMAVGIIFLSLTPGYTDPMSYLFGNILILSVRDLWLVAILDVVLLAIGVLGYSRLQAVCFDEEFARLRGVHVGFYYTLLLSMVALSVVLLVSVVGIVLVVALLTLPAAIAGRFTSTLRGMMIVSSLLALMFIVGGLSFSYGSNLPAGAVIVLLAAGVYLLSLFRRSRA